MGSAFKILPHYTYEDYSRWEGQWELIEGIPYAMSPAPNIRHQRISGKLFQLFVEALSAIPCQCEVLLPVDYKISDDTIVQPDLLILCPPAIQKMAITEKPALVIEILSPSTAMKDRNNKFIIYQSQKVPYYLIVDPDKNEVEVYSLNHACQYELIPAQTSYRFVLDDTCFIDVEFSSVWP